MCNHYKPGDNPEAFEAAVKEMLAKLLAKPSPAPGIEAWPKRPAPVVFVDENGPVLDRMRWGVAVPIKGKTSYVTNARNDKLLGFPWRFAARERRCLIPARGYFEPGTGPVGARGELFFTVKDRPLFYFAGLWDTDRDEAGARAFTMVTTTPNTYAAQFHDRMPVVLSNADAKRWLGNQPLPDDELLGFCRPLPDEVMQHQDRPALPKMKITKVDLSTGELGL